MELLSIERHSLFLCIRVQPHLMNRRNDLPLRYRACAHTANLGYGVRSTEPGQYMCFDDSL
jgi:hypothetical protein